jgi:hypothetical protein
VRFGLRLQLTCLAKRSKDRGGDCSRWWGAWAPGWRSGTELSASRASETRCPAGYAASGTDHLRWVNAGGAESIVWLADVPRRRSGAAETGTTLALCSSIPLMAKEFPIFGTLRKRPALASADVPA